MQKCISQVIDHFTAEIRRMTGQAFPGHLLANKAVNFSEFPFRSYREEELPTLIQQYAELYESNAYLPEQFDIIKFIF